MKKLFKILTAVLAVFSFASCAKCEDAQKENLPLEYTSKVEFSIDNGETFYSKKSDLEAFPSNTTILEKIVFESNQDVKLTYQVRSLGVSFQYIRGQLIDGPKVIEYGQYVTYKYDFNILKSYPFEFVFAFQHGGGTYNNSIKSLLTVDDKIIENFSSVIIDSNKYENQTMKTYSPDKNFEINNIDNNHAVINHLNASHNCEISINGDFNFNFKFENKNFTFDKNGKNMISLSQAKEFKIALYDNFILYEYSDAETTSENFSWPTTITSCDHIRHTNSDAHYFYYELGIEGNFQYQLKEIK